MDPLATYTNLLNVVTRLHVTDKFNADEYIKIEREHYGRIWNLDDQQASTIHRTRMWHCWFQPRKASSWTESQCMIPNWSTHESYVSNMSSQDYELSTVKHHYLMRVVLCLLNRRQSWILNSKLNSQVGSNECRMLSSSMDVSCCEPCIGPRVAALRPIMINFMDTIKYHMERPGVYMIFEGTSETVKSRWRNPVDQAMMLVESINSAFTQHCPPRTWLST